MDSMLIKYCHEYFFVVLETVPYTLSNQFGLRKIIFLREYLVRVKSILLLKIFYIQSCDTANVKRTKQNREKLLITHSFSFHLLMRRGKNMRNVKTHAKISNKQNSFLPHKWGEMRRQFIWIISLIYINMTYTNFL